MVGEWNSTTLGMICTTITDGAHHSPKSVNVGMPMASVKDMYHWGLDLNSARHISEEEYLNLVQQGCKPQVGDVLIAKDGNSALDTVCVVGKSLDVVLLSSVAILRPNQEKIIPSFLKYYFMSPQNISYLKRNFISGAAIPRVILKDFKKAEIILPGLDEQERIVNILCTLDEKIDLNRRMNETLETMAQALFKSWFVDFDPVIDNALAAGNEIPESLQERAAARQALGDKRKPFPEDIRELFPDSFVFDDELGWIPEGWEIMHYGGMLKLAYGKSLTAKKRIPGPFPVYGSGGISGSHIEALIDGPGIIIGRKGTVGSVYWVEQNYYPIDTVFYVNLKVDIPLYWLYQKLLLLDIAALASDSAVPGVNRNAIYAHKSIIPSGNILDRYWVLNKKHLERIDSNNQQNDGLSNLRDILLPKLLSGELRIPDAEKLIEETV